MFADQNDVALCCGVLDADSLSFRFRENRERTVMHASRPETCHPADDEKNSSHYRECQMEF